MATRSCDTISDSGAGQRPPIDTLAMELVNEMQAIFGKHPGFRTTHAKGLLVEGTFTPTEQAKTLSMAPHFWKASTPVIARFSVGGGIPGIPDVNNVASPKGLAIRFRINNEIYTDLISHSFNGFATTTGQEFLTFLRLTRALQGAQQLLKMAVESGADTQKERELLQKAQANMGAFVATRPRAAEFLQAPKPNPFNYGTMVYYQPNTHILTNKDGKTTQVRYRLVPADGVQLYPNDPAQLEKLAPNYLEDDLKQRFPGKPIVFDIQAHIPDPDDVLDDATIPYKSTTFFSVGRLELNRVAEDNDVKQQHIAFSPTPERGGVRGIKSSNDPLIQTRKGVYRISADQRRHETQVGSRM